MFKRTKCIFRTKRNISCSCKNTNNNNNNTGGKFKALFNLIEVEINSVLNIFIYRYQTLSNDYNTFHENLPILIDLKLKPPSDIFGNTMAANLKHRQTNRTESKLYFVDCKIIIYTHTF